MKEKVFIFIVLCVSFWSCKEVSYPVPQPKGVASLQKLPENLQGKYLPIDQPASEKPDTLIIESWGYHFSDKNGKDWLGRGVLSDSLVVKFYMNYYFVNFKSGDQWILRLIAQKPSGDLTFMSIDLKEDAQISDIINKISKRLKVTEIKRESDVFYQINPTPAQLMALVKDGYFAGVELRKTK